MARRCPGCDVWRYKLKSTPKTRKRLFFDAVVIVLVWYFFNGIIGASIRGYYVDEEAEINFETRNKPKKNKIPLFNGGHSIFLHKTIRIPLEEPECDKNACSEKYSD
jgi:hypothetical protein